LLWTIITYNPIIQIQTINDSSTESSPEPEPVVFESIIQASF
jgi:hypothetical protein